MNEYTFTTHGTGFKQETASTKSDMMVLIEGLGRNILLHLGNVELGKSLRIFMSDKDNQPVGGIAADLSGGWAYISLSSECIERSLNVQTPRDYSGRTVLVTLTTIPDSVGSGQRTNSVVTPSGSITFS